MTIRARRPALPRSMAGVSLVELMVAMALGLIVLAALVSVFANSSASRNELERSSRQIENGRYAMDLLSEDLRLAGFFGELKVASTIPGKASTTNVTIAMPAAMPDPCSTNPADWVATMLMHVQGYDNGAGLAATTCAIANLKPNTDVVVMRRVAACEAGVSGCPAAVGGAPYLQVSKCAPETPITAFVLGLQGTAGYPLRLKDCTTRAGMRLYYVRIYYIATDNGATPPVSIPTLTRLDFTGAGFTVTPLVEGIEELNIEYGVDYDNDGAPDGYTADPTTWVPAACPTCTAITNWANVVSARVYLLARNIDPSPNYTDSKTYTLGNDAAGNPVTVTPTGPGAAYRRHVYTGLIRVVNAAERRELP